MYIRAICGSFRRRVWHPAIPTPPAANPPIEFTEFTEVSGVGYSPTDFTDAHRFLGCVFALNLCASVKSVGGFLRQTVLCVPRVLWDTLPICFVGAVLALASGKAEQRQLHQRGSILPRISRISTEVRLRYWRRGYGRDAIPS